MASLFSAHHVAGMCFCAPCSLMSEEKKNSKRGMNVIVVNGQLNCETVSRCIVTRWQSTVKQFHVALWLIDTRLWNSFTLRCDSLTLDCETVSRCIVTHWHSTVECYLWNVYKYQDENRRQGWVAAAAASSDYD